MIEKRNLKKSEDTDSAESSDDEEKTESTSSSSSRLMGHIDPVFSHLLGAWQRFCAIGGTLEAIERDMSKEDLALWMSALICVRSAACERAFAMISGGQDGTALQGFDQKIMLWDKDKCPPGCNCDNPWAFMPDSVTSKPGAFGVPMSLRRRQQLESQPK